MKRNLCIVLAITSVLCFVSVAAVAKSAGEIKDNVYSDSECGFSFSIPDGWSTKIGSGGKQPVRIVLTQKSYSIPPNFQGNEGYVTIPTITAMVDTTSLTPDKFIEYLMDSKTKTKQKSFMLEKLKIISRPYDVEKMKKMTLANADAAMLVAKQQYSAEIVASRSVKGAADEVDRSSDRAEVITGYYGGAIFCTVRNGKAYIFHMMCDRAFYAANEQVFLSVIGSLKIE